MINTFELKNYLIRELNHPKDPDFNNYGTTRNYWYYNLYVGSKDLDELDALTKTPPTSKKVISKGDKIFFSKKTTFPTLLLSRLDTDVKRVVKEDKADVYVIDKPKVLYSVDTYIAYFTETQNQEPVLYWENVSKYETEELNKLVNKWKSALNSDEIYFLRSYSCDDHTIFNTCLNSNKPIVYTDDFIKYIDKFRPKLEGDELDSVLNMLKSPDDESYAAGINLIPYYNIEDVKFEIFWHLKESVKNGRSSISKGKVESYVFSLIQLTPGAIKKKLRWFSNDINAIKYLFNEYHITYGSIPAKQKYCKPTLLENICTNFYIQELLRRADLKIELVPESGEVQNFNGCKNKNEKETILNTINNRYDDLLKFTHLEVRVYDKD